MSFAATTPPAAAASATASRLFAAIARYSRAEQAEQRRRRFVSKITLEPGVSLQTEFHQLHDNRAFADSASVKIKRILTREASMLTSPPSRITFVQRSFLKSSNRRAFVSFDLSFAAREVRGASRFRILQNSRSSCDSILSRPRLLYDARIKGARERNFLRFNGGKRVNTGKLVLVFVTLLSREAELYFRQVYALELRFFALASRPSQGRNADNEENEVKRGRSDH